MITPDEALGIDISELEVGIDSQLKNTFVDGGSVAINMKGCTAKTIQAVIDLYTPAWSITNEDCMLTFTRPV